MVEYNEFPGMCITDSIIDVYYIEANFSGSCLIIDGGLGFSPYWQYVLILDGSLAFQVKNRTMFKQVSLLASKLLLFWNSTIACGGYC